MITRLVAVVVTADPDPTLGLTGERFEFFGMGLTLLLAIAAALATWLFSGGAE